MKSEQQIRAQIATLQEYRQHVISKIDDILDCENLTRINMERRESYGRLVTEFDVKIDTLKWVIRE